MTGDTVFETALQLTEIEHLFVTQDISPLSNQYQIHNYIAGIEFVANELYTDPSQNAVTLKILLPPDQITDNLQEQTLAAVVRYCQERLADVNHDVHAILWRRSRALAMALLGLIRFTRRCESDRQRHERLPTDYQ